MRIEWKYKTIDGIGLIYTIMKIKDLLFQWKMCLVEIMLLYDWKFYGVLLDMCGYKSQTCFKLFTLVKNGLKSLI